MADNVNLPGTGTNVRAKNLSGVFTQLAQLDIGGEAAELQWIAGTNTMANSAPVTIASDQTPVPTAGVIVHSTATVTRAANVTAYTTMQVVKDNSNAYQTFTGAARVSGGSGMIIAASILDEVYSTTPLSPMLYLFTAAPTNSTFTDLSALALANADGLVLVPGSPITFAVSTTVNASAAPNGATYYSAQGLSLGFDLATGTSLFGVLVSGSSYVPKSGGLLVVRLTIVQN